MSAFSHSTLAGVVRAVKQSKEDAEMNAAIEEHERITRKVVSVRMDAADIYTLEGIAKEMGLSRTAAAQQLLEVAIHEVADGLGVRPFSFEYDYDRDNPARVIVSADGKTPIVVEDDALIVAGGEDR